MTQSHDWWAIGGNIENRKGTKDERAAFPFPDPKVERIAELEAQVAELQQTADSLSHSWRVEVETLQAALRPFAIAGHALRESTPDSLILWSYQVPGQKLIDITAGDFRAAAKAAGES